MSNRKFSKVRSLKIRHNIVPQTKGSNKDDYALHKDDYALHKDFNVFTKDGVNRRVISDKPMTISQAQIHYDVLCVGAND